MRAYIEKLPDIIPPEKHRFFVFGSYIYLFSFTGHTVFIPVFYLMGNTIALYNNILCVALDALCLVLHRRGRFNTGVFVWACAITYHTSYCLLAFGKDTGLLYYYLIVTMIVFFSEWCLTFKVIGAALIAAICIVMFEYTKVNSPLTPVTGRILMLWYASNFLANFTAVAYTAYYFLRVAEAANRAKTAFLANMSHDIRTPLNAIMGFTQILLAEEKDPSSREKLSIISQSGEILLATINNILDISRIEAGKMTLDATEFSLDDLCDKIRQEFTLRVREKNLVLTITAGADMPPFVLGDQHRTQQIVSNLVDNALKFTERGGVTLEYAFDSGMVTFRVSDTGIGIPGDKCNAVFSAFHQVDHSSTRQHGGSGLGLAIVKSLTEQMGGSITLQSEVGRGSTFTVTLPLQEVRSGGTREKVHALPGDIAKADAPVGSFRVLVAEDNDLNRQLMVRLLETQDMGYEIAVNGRDALDMLLSARDAGRPFDLLFLDIQMPVMDGTECIAEIRRDKAFSGLTVVALTAHALTEDAENFIKMGFNDYISKPIDIHEFIKKLKSFSEYRKIR